MPSRINTATQAARLIKEFFLQGDYRLQMDETVAPVAIVTDVSQDVTPPSFGEPPGDDRATAGFLLGEFDQFSGDSQLLVIRAGSAPLNIERISWGGLGSGNDFYGVVWAGAAGGTIVTGGGSWGARRPGRPSATFEVGSSAVLPNSEILAIFDGSNAFAGLQEVNLALQAGSGDLSAITIGVGVINVPQGGAPAPVFLEPVSVPWSCTVQWRE